MLFVMESTITFNNSIWMDINFIFARGSKLVWFLCEGSKYFSFFVRGIEINLVQCGTVSCLGFVQAENILVLNIYMCAGRNYLFFLYGLENDMIFSLGTD